MCEGIAKGTGFPTDNRAPKLFEGKNALGTWWKLYQGDALEALKLIEDQTVDCVVTSPPYFWLRDYGIEGQIGLERTVEEYVAAVNSVMLEVRRILKTTGTLFVNLGDTYYSGKGKSHGKDKKSKKRRFGLRAVDKSGGLDIGFQRKSMIGIPWRVALRMCENQWVLRSCIVWHRDKCLPEAVHDRPRRSYEFVFMFAKNRHYYFKRRPLIDGKFDEDVWTIRPRSKNNGKVDSAPFPEELVERCLAIGCPVDGVVFDPFVGAGTTMHVGLKRGNPAMGIEINPDFCSYILTTLQR